MMLRSRFVNIIYNLLALVVSNDVSFDEIKVNKEVEEILNVVRTTVLVVDVVSMLPDINSKERSFTMSNRGVSIMITLNLHLTIFVNYKPCPTRTKVSCSGLGDLLKDFLDTTHISSELLKLNMLGRRVGAFNVDTVPEESMVVCLSSVVEKRSVIGLLSLKDKLFKGLIFKLWLVLGNVCKVVKVSTVMLVPVE